MEDIIKSYFSNMGKKGGVSRSERKIQASKTNIAKAQAKLKEIRESRHD